MLFHNFFIKSSRNEQVKKSKRKESHYDHPSHFVCFMPNESEITAIPAPEADFLVGHIDTITVDVKFLA